MPNYYDSQDKPISLTKEIAKGGEGIVWQTDRSGYLAKTYHQQDREQIEKLKLMVANPPQNPTASQNHISISWPTDLIKDNLGKSPNWVGFLMPEIRNTKGIFCVYHPKSREKNAPQYNWYCLHIMALNIAAIVREVHAKNYVIGDLNPKNILVNDRSLVCLIDTDSFQVTDPTTRKVYRCSVGFPGFSPPELIGKKLIKITQKPEHDRFRLAVMIYHLLFGYHPFMGKWTGPGNPPGQDEAISKGYWLYAKKSLLKQNLFQPTPNTIPLKVLHPKLEQCFLRCFNDGHQSPTSRPSPEDWVDALQVAINDLVVCSKNPNHIYSKHSGSCYWCDRAKTLRVDIFPSVPNPIPPQKVSLLSPQSSPQSSPKSSTQSSPQSSSLQAQNNLLNQRIQQLQSQNNLLNQQIQNLQTENNLLNQEISLLKQQLSSQNKLHFFLTQVPSFFPINLVSSLIAKPLQICQSYPKILTNKFQILNIKLSSQQQLVRLQQWLATNPKLKLVAIGVFVAIVLVWLSSM